MASHMLGTGATRVDDRLKAASGQSFPPIEFASCMGLDYGGVLFLLPFLLANGLLSYQKYYSQRQAGYYDFDSSIIALAFIYLCRIQSLEQLKHYSSAELGRLIGLDRIPEVRCFRGVVDELTQQKQAPAWNAYLAESWIEQEQPGMYYIDGHVQVYHGYWANLGKKHVSRQRLCLPGMMEFWVNNVQGLPYFFVTGQVNEKLQEMLVNTIIPQLNQWPQASVSAETLRADPLRPRYSLVFDREAYSPKLFGWLWQTHRIAVITYRKNVKDQWDEAEFTDYEVQTDGSTPTTMALHEKQVEIDGVSLREIRKKNSDNHQTSVLTTNWKLSLDLVARYMFARWSQENFFRYMRQEYDLDKIMQYGVDQLDTNIHVVNRAYSKLTYQLKKVREKIARRKAQLFTLAEENLATEIDQSGGNMKKQLELRQEIENLEQEEARLIQTRKEQPYKIPIGQMPESSRYNKLKAESKHLQNIIKIICYRAETAFANWLAPHYAKSKEEIRALVKSIIFNKIDLIPDYTANKLSVKLYTLATPRDNAALAKICQDLNATETCFPGTNLKLQYKCATF